MKTTHELANRLDGLLGAVINRAAELLPEDYIITLEIERGCACVYLYVPDTDAHISFGDDVMSALGYALKRSVSVGFSISTDFDTDVLLKDALLKDALLKDGFATCA